MSDVLYAVENGDKFWCTHEQRNVLDVLYELQHGGIATIHGYTPTTGWELPPVNDVQVITKISIESLYRRKIQALDSVSFADVKPMLACDEKLSQLSESEARKIFNDRKQKLIDSMTKTLEGDRSDSRRAAHDAHNITVTKGVKVNLKSGKIGKEKHVIIKDGSPIAESILLNCIEISKKEIRPGVRKVVNSGVEVLMGNCIENCLNKRSVGLKTYSLDPSKFESIVVSKKTILKEDLVQLPYYEDIVE
jgi:hypothetical protein